VKRYGEGNKVSSPEVREYSGLLHRDDTDVVAIVTTSGYTEPAEEFAERSGVILLDGCDLAEMIKEAK
jgi:restriction system protein